MKRLYLTLLAAAVLSLTSLLFSTSPAAHSTVQATVPSTPSSPSRHTHTGDTFITPADTR